MRDVYSLQEQEVGEFLRTRERSFQHVTDIEWKDLTGTKPTLEKRFQQPPDILKIKANGTWVSACDATFRDPKQFVPGTLKFCLQFWETILKNHPEKHELLGWLRGVKIEQYLNTYTDSAFNGQRVHGFYPPQHRAKNLVPDKFTDWVTQEIQEWESRGIIIRETTQIRAEVICPLSVEPNKPRLIYDARYINLFFKDKKFSMDGVGKWPEVGWRGMYMFSVDHKSGYHHVPLHYSAWKFFGLKWEGIVYMCTTLNFGWKLAPFIYHTLTEATCMYVRELIRIPALAWLDDIAGANTNSTRQEQPVVQWKAANRAVFTYSMVLYKAGYFLSLNKSALKPTQSLRYLGIVTDSKAERFFVPQDRIDNLMRLIISMLHKGWAYYQELEKCVGKCRSMSIAVPCAILYTREQYTQLRLHERKGGSIILGTTLREELGIWLQLGNHKALINGSRWYNAEHYVVTNGGTGYTDASGRRWGGLIRTPEKTFVSAADFGEDMLAYHIGQKEAVGLRNVLVGFVESTPTIKGKLFVIFVDNEGLFYILEKGGSTRDTITTNICKELFWLQINNECVFKYKWTPTHLNQADGLTREDPNNDVRLEREVFLELNHKYGPFQMDLMASAANVQADVQGNKLPFYSQYYTQEAQGTDVFSVNVQKGPGSKSNKANNYCFPPLKMVGLVLKHLRECKARCVIIAPEVQAAWYPGLMEACLSKRVIAEPFQKGAFQKFCKGEIRPFQSKFRMTAFLVHFR